MSNIIAFCGKKGSGKNTCSNFLHGYQMKCYGIVEDFGILNDTGALVVTTKTLDEGGNEGTTTGELDINRDDIEFADWAVYNMWPFIKNYSFAKELKDICAGLFNIPRECLYGTDEQKNQIQEHLLWENMPGVTCLPNHEWVNIISGNYNDQNIQYACELLNLVYHTPGPMTAREFMQFFGTDIMRKIYGPIWTNRTIKNIKTENPQLAIISDCRFKNEAQALRQEKAKLIRLTRSTASDKHSSENAFEDFNDFDAVIDNQNMTIEETQHELIKVIDSWGWLGDLIANNTKKNKGVKKIK
jgi:hypothetical protein